MITIKSQKISPTLPAESASASFVVAQENYFAVFSYQSKEPVSTQVAQNIVTDIFAHTMVLEGSEAVLQVLEESLKNCKEAVQKIREDALFTAVVAYFKDDFAYVSIYGDAKALYLDGTQMVHVDTDKEGHFAGGTQKIDDGKVMVLCTHDFFNKFPPKSLVSLDKPILAQDLADLESAVILKVDKVDEEKAPVVVNEKISDEKKFGDPALGGKSHGLVKTIGDSKAGANNTSSGVAKSAIGVVAGSTPGSKFRSFIKPALILIGVVGLVVGGYFILKPTFIKPKTPVSQVVQPNNKGEGVTKPDTTSQTPQDKEIQGELSKKLDEANKVNRVQAQVFYDISITDAKTSPTELAQGPKYLAVSDATQGKIYISAKDVTKFEELPQLFPGVKNLLFDGDTLVFTDNEGIKFYAIATKSVNKSYLTDETYGALGPSSEYLGFTYAVTGDKLVKFTKTGNKMVGTLWAQKEEFTGAVSVDIDGSIYVLFSNGNLEKYTAGTKDDFSIVGLDKPVQKPLKVATNSDYKQIYVADGAEGRIIAFDEDGVLEFQIKPELGSEWTALKSFDISADEKTFYVLSGTKVFEFRL